MGFDKKIWKFINQILLFISCIHIWNKKKSEIKLFYFTKLMQILQNELVFMTVKMTVFIAV